MPWQGSPSAWMAACLPVGAGTARSKSGMWLAKPSSHYSCTYLEAEGAVHAELLSSLARVHVGLQGGCRLLQTIDRQVLRHAQMWLVVALMDDAMGLPGAGRTLVIDTAGGEATPFAHKPEGRHGSQPGKPLRGIGHQREFAFLRTDHHVLAVSAIFDQ